MDYYRITLSKGSDNDTIIIGSEDVIDTAFDKNGKCVYFKISDIAKTASITGMTVDHHRVYYADKVSRNRER